MLKLRNIAVLLFLCLAISVQAIDLNSKGRDPKYVASIVGRSQKIVNKLALTDTVQARQVCNVIANRYFELNDIYEVRDAKVKQVKEGTLTGDAKQQALDAAQDEKDRKLYRSHFAFAANLGLFLNDEQVEAVKDGMTYGVVKVTYDATLEMIPSLTQEEKIQILAWLKEAREFAMDAENSNKKHEAFGKYKGRINNYLSARGYNLVKEREQWYKRIEEKKKNTDKK